jgi:hypothetical protein
MSSNIENAIKVGTTQFWINTKAILYCKFCNENPSYKLDTVRAKLYIEVITELCNGKAMPFLIDLRGVNGTFTPSAANLIAQSPVLNVLRISEAFVFDSIGLKLLITSYKRIYNPITPYRMLNNMELAEDFCIETKNKFYGSN